jgi:N utilization substance protein B
MIEMCYTFDMPLPQQKFREAVFQILFSFDFDLTEQTEMVAMMMSELKTTRQNMKEALDRVNQILSKKDQIDNLITGASQEYTFDRISRVEKTILRLSLYEMLFDEEIPALVAIAEAIRLCRKFGTPESSQFVNAILDGVYKSDDVGASKESLSV